MLKFQQNLQPPPPLIFIKLLYILLTINFLSFAEGKCSLGRKKTCYCPNKTSWYVKNLTWRLVTYSQFFMSAFSANLPGMWNHANITNDSIGWVGRWCESTNQNSFLIECHGLCWQSQNACPKRRFPVRTVKVKRRGQSRKFALVSILNKLFYAEVFKLYFWVRYFSKLTLKVYAYPQPQNNNWSITSIFFFLSDEVEVASPAAFWRFV